MFYSSNAASKWCCLNGFPCTFAKYLFRVCLINARFPLTAACQPPSFWSIFLCISLLFTVLFLCFKATCVFQRNVVSLSAGMATNWLWNELTSQWHSRIGCKKFYYKFYKFKWVSQTLYTCQHFVILLFLIFI